MSVYSVAVLVIVLCGGLEMVIGQSFAVGMDNVYAFANMMKCSAYIISHSGFLFFTLLFRRKIIKFLHLLLSFNSSIHTVFVSYGRNSNYIMVQVYVLLTLNTTRSVLIALAFEFKGFSTVSLYFSMTVAVLSLNLLIVLFINFSVVLNKCFTRINSCLLDLIQCEGEESVGIYRQAVTVTHQQQLIEVNFNSDRPKCRLEHVRRGCDFLCDSVDLFNSVYSAHTLVLVTFYVVMFIYESYYGFVGIMDVNRGSFGSVVWIRVTFTEATIHIVGFMVLLYFCSSTSCEVRRCTNVLLLITVLSVNELKNIINFEECRVNVCSSIL
jgi:hypothetical protein